MSDSPLSLYLSPCQDANEALVFAFLSTQRSLQEPVSTPVPNRVLLSSYFPAQTPAHVPSASAAS